MEDDLKAHEGVQDTDSYWKTFSKSVGQGIIRYIDEEKESKKIAGRGTIILQEMAPRRRDTVDDAKDVLKNEWSKKALENLKQARRCEQIAYRIKMINKEECGAKKCKHIELNKQAMKVRSKMADKNYGV